MAFASIFRRVAAARPSALNSQLPWIRLHVTLTSPKLFISGISRVTTDEKLRETFAPFGQLVEAKVITDRATGTSKGFGFVTYTTIEEAEKAREGMNAKFLDGWAIFVDPAKPKGEPRPPPSRRVEQESLDLGFKTNRTTVGFGEKFGLDKSW